LHCDLAERLAAETLWTQAQEALATQGPATAQQAVERHEEKPPFALADKIHGMSSPDPSPPILKSMFAERLNDFDSIASFSI
jgi:hypothetical protein